MERQAAYCVESAHAPIVLSAGRRVIVSLAEGTAAGVQMWGDGGYEILVSDRVPARYVQTVAHHVMSHLDDVEGLVTAWCERSTCWAACAWLPVVPALTAAGL